MGIKVKINKTVIFHFMKFKVNNDQFINRTNFKKNP